MVMWLVLVTSVAGTGVTSGTHPPLQVPDEREERDEEEAERRPADHQQQRLPHHQACTQSTLSMEGEAAFF